MGNRFRFVEISRPFASRQMGTVMLRTWWVLSLASAAAALSSSRAVPNCALKPSCGLSEPALALHLRGGGGRDDSSLNRLLSVSRLDKAACLAIAVSTICFNMHGAIWYGWLFARTWARLMTEFRGIETSLEASFQARWPYPMEASYASSMLCGLVKSYMVWHVFKALGISGNAIAAVKLGLLMYLMFGFTTLHHEVWEGKRLEHVLINQLQEMTSAVLVSLVIWGMACE